MQGGLAGFAATTVVATYAVGDDTSAFVTQYAHVSMETRRVFFFLINIALVGACDVLAAARADRAAWKAMSLFARIEAWLLVLL